MEKRQYVDLDQIADNAELRKLAEDAGFDVKEIRTSAVAHLIRIGQRPDVGLPLGFAIQIKKGGEFKNGNFLAASLDTAEPLSPKLWVRMDVRQADIDGAHELINSQQIKYAEPKTSWMMLKKRRSEL